MRKVSATLWLSSPAGMPEPSTALFSLIQCVRLLNFAVRGNGVFSGVLGLQSGSAGMIDTGKAAGRDGVQTAEGDAMTLSRLRHDIRNLLNTIKLSTALLHRQRLEKAAIDPIREIDKAADGINQLVSRFMGDADAPGLFQSTSDQSRDGK
jgi:hypothetical protein